MLYKILFLILLVGNVYGQVEKSTGTVTPVEPILTAEQIAWEKVWKIEAVPEIAQVRVAYYSDSKDFDIIRKKLLHSLAVLELEQEGRGKHQKCGRRYAPVLYPIQIEKRKAILQK